MAKVSWISATPNLLKGVQLINSVDEKKFPLVLNRIVQSIPGSTQFCPFTEDEEEKLLDNLSGVNCKDDLKLILDTSTYILLQATYNVTKPAVLKNDVIEYLKMNEVKADIFYNIWINHAKAIVENFRQKSIHNAQLEGVSWMLNVSAASSQKNENCEPRAVIELKINQDNEADHNLVLDMNRSQLYELYTTIENIQSELDNLR